MREYVRSIDKLNKVIKFIIAFFLDPIIFGIYRIAKGKLLIGIIWIFTFGLFGVGWLIDLIEIVLNNKVKFLT